MATTMLGGEELWMPWRPTSSWGMPPSSSSPLRAPLPRRRPTMLLEELDYAPPSAHRQPARVEAPPRPAPATATSVQTLGRTRTRTAALATSNSRAMTAAMGGFVRRNRFFVVKYGTWAGLGLAYYAYNHRTPSSSPSS